MYKKKEDLAVLLERRGRVCVSLYMPAERAGREVRQNRIRFKNLLAEARRRVEASEELRPHEIDDLLAPAQGLLGRTDFWSHQKEGLATFHSEGFSRTFRLPVRFDEELCYVGHRFHVKPLLSAFLGGGRFHVLALSRQSVDLYEGSRDALARMAVPGMPARLEDVVGAVVEAEGTQWHTGAAASPGGRRPALFHGKGAGEDDDEPEVRAFLREVDAHLRDALRSEEGPLVLAAPAELGGRYAGLTQHPGGIAGQIPVNPAGISEEELHRRAWALVEPLLAEERRAAARRYHERQGTPATSTEVDEIVSAAAAGRVEHLFVRPWTQQWGRLDGEEVDLLDVAAARTLLHGGKVHMPSDGTLPPDGTPIAALFRY